MRSNHVIAHNCQGVKGFCLWSLVVWVPSLAVVSSPACFDAAHQSHPHTRSCPDTVPHPLNTARFCCQHPGTLANSAGHPGALVPPQ